MRTALDVSPEALDPQETNFVAQIREHGWFRTNVFAEGDEPGFSYTTGFWVTAKAPEVIVFDLPSQVAHDVLWDLYRGFKAGVAFPVGQRLSNIFANLDAVLLPVAKAYYPDYLGWGRWFHAGDEWPCLQLVWPDANGLFPWEPGFNERFVGKQPNLTGSDWSAI